MSGVDVLQVFLQNKAWSVLQVETQVTKLDFI